MRMNALMLKFAEIVMALIAHAPDSDSTVRDSISASLYDVGAQSIAHVWYSRSRR